MVHSEKYQEAIAKQESMSSTEHVAFLDGMVHAALSDEHSENPFAVGSPGYWGFIVGLEDSKGARFDMDLVCQMGLETVGLGSFSSY